MKLDPVDTFTGTFTSLLARVAGAWCAATLGFAISAIAGSGLEDLGDHARAVILLPLTLTGLAVASGWWSFVAIPLACLLAWRALLFVRGDLPWSELLILTLLSYLVCIRLGSGMGSAGKLALAGFMTWVVSLMMHRQGGASEDA